MSPLKRFLPLAVLALCVPAIAFAAADPGDWTKFDTFRQNADVNCDQSALFSGWQSQSPLKSVLLPYVAVGSDDAVGNYWSYLANIRASTDCLSRKKYGITILDQASCVYLETQNTLYGCYSMQTKIQIAKVVLEQFSAAGGNGTAKAKLENRIKAMERMVIGGGGSSEGVCNKVTFQDEISMKEDLLKNSTVHLCRYEYYLSYLAANAKFDAKKFLTNKTPQGDVLSVGNVQDANAALANVANAIGREKAHVRDVYGVAMAAYAEMEQTYGQHIMYGVILDDLISIRDGLKSLLNPIGQFVYKASNAQSPYNQ